jgi:hypothetical protein
MGGAGKSYIALDLALAIAYGAPMGDDFQPRKFMSGEIAKTGKAVFLTAEDSADELHRRINAIDESKARFEKNNCLFAVPFPSVGGAPQLMIEESNNVFVMTPAYNQIRETLRNINELRLIVIDPLQAFIGADVNSSPGAGQFLFKELSALAVETGATVIVTHHMRKFNGEINTVWEAREAIRGTTALVDGSRLTYALWPSKEDELREVAEHFNIEDYNPGTVLKGAIVKTNQQANQSVRTYVRKQNGLLIDRTDELPEQSEGGISIARTNEILTAIGERWDRGDPLSRANNTGDKNIISWMARKFGVSRKAGRELFANWMDDGYLVEDVYSAKRKINGIRLVRVAM